VKKAILLLCSLALALTFSFMNTPVTSINGIYSLTGMHEMAGGFKFETNGEFQFFYSYGAVDRMADGSFTVEGNKVILKSSKEPGKDFTVTKQSGGTTGFSIKITAPNEYLAAYVKCIVLNGDEKAEFISDNKGMIKMNVSKADKIYLQHQLYPDIVTLVKDSLNNNTQFEVALNQSLEKVSFKGIDLTINGDTLTMLPNYFMPYENIRFVKNR
jgi:hypothetical protein